MTRYLLPLLLATMAQGGDEPGVRCDQQASWDERVICNAAELERLRRRAIRLTDAAEDVIRGGGGRGEWLIRFHDAAEAWTAAEEADCGDVVDFGAGPGATGVERQTCHLAHVMTWMAELQDRFALPGATAPPPVAAPAASCAPAHPFGCPELAQADAALNAAFEKTLAGVAGTAATEAENRELEKTWRAAIRNNQRLWLKWRDTWCGPMLDAELKVTRPAASEAERLGARVSCLVRATRERTGLLPQP